MHFSEGLTIITGETGAGKSILLGALGLIMGKRADTKTLYNPDEKCVVEGRFVIQSYSIRSFFERNDIDYDDELVVRREITPSGKSRAFINDTPVNLKLLQELTGYLLDLHQQFDTLDMQETSFQIKAVDALADNKKLVLEYQELYQSYRSEQRQLEQLLVKESTASNESDFLKFQHEELVNANLQSGEQKSQEAEQVKLDNAEDIKRVTATSFQFLSESEQSVVGQLQDIGQSLNAISKYDSKIQGLQSRYDGLVLELQDIAHELERIADETEFNEERSVEIRERLDLIYRLQSKHNVKSVEELLDIQETLAKKLGQYGDMSAEITALRERIAEKESRLFEIGTQISERRSQVTDGFVSDIKRLLGMLAMEHAEMQIDILPQPSLGPDGLDQVNFLFSANKGARLQLIREVASGGELSRLALVLKSLVADSIPLPTLIFDEIDAGISGDVALKMGRILRQLADRHQIVTITHSPQVSSKADVHYFVYKKIKDERTVTNVRLLTKDERIRAIAVMLSQNPPSDSAIENARELVEQS